MTNDQSGLVDVLVNNTIFSRSFQTFYYYVCIYIFVRLSATLDIDEFLKFEPQITLLEK